MKKHNLLFLFVAFFAFVVMEGCRPSPSSTAPPLTPTLLPPSPSPTPTGKTIVVTSPADSGPGTLRQAMEEAQSGDTITFDPVVFPPDAPVTIFIASELPHIRQGNLTIDASNAGVILDGRDAAGDWLAGLQIVESDANIIQGLQISNFSVGDRYQRRCAIQHNWWRSQYR